MEWVAGRGTQAMSIIGTVLGGAAVAGLPLFAGANRNAGNPDNQPVSKYEAAQAARIAELETEVKLRDANTYTDSKILETYRYIDGRLRSVESQLCQQEVWNATQTATMSCMASQIAALNGMTKMVIPKGNVCPEPMDRYNSWTAPTAAAATT